MSDEKPIKKASELLVEINQKLDSLLGIVRNQDLLLKTLNNRISKNSQSIPPPENKIINSSTELVSDDEFVQVNTDEFNAEIQKSGGKKVAVQQRVTYSDGKNICLASVEITGDNLKSSKKLKTNAMGKWIAVLEPGNYVVRISKPANKNKQVITISSSFTVTESDKPVELPGISE